MKIDVNANSQAIETLQKQLNYYIKQSGKAVTPLNGATPSNADMDDVNSSMDSINDRLKKLEKNDTYQDQHITVHTKQIEELNKMMKGFAAKLTQLKS